MKFIDWYPGCSSFRKTETFNLHKMFARIQYGVDDSLCDLHPTKRKWHKSIQEASELDRTARASCIQMTNVIEQK